MGSIKKGVWLENFMMIIGAIIDFFFPLSFLTIFFLVIFWLYFRFFNLFLIF